MNAFGEGKELDGLAYPISTTNYYPTIFPNTGTNVYGTNFGGRNVDGANVEDRRPVGEATPGYQGHTIHNNAFGEWKDWSGPTYPISTTNYYSTISPNTGANVDETNVDGMHVDGANVENRRPDGEATPRCQGYTMHNGKLRRGSNVQESRKAGHPVDGLGALDRLIGERTNKR
jgi:hypothetical protein